MNYYNENDPFAAQWLRNLIAANLIPSGFVDERSILDVKPNDLVNYDQCHFFAGIGGWSRALQIAAWPVHRKVWTGSCPCQPFSAAGQGVGFADERHLWPAWFHLIEQCAPEQIFGEQVASKAGLEWFDLVRTDLESAAYSVACADLCAAGVGAPHIRQRLWFVGHAESGERRLSVRPQRREDFEFTRTSEARGVADAVRSRARNASRQSLGAEAAADEKNGGLSGQRLRIGEQGSALQLAFTKEQQFDRRGDTQTRRREFADDCELGDTGSTGLQKRERNGRVQREALESFEGKAVVGRGNVGAWTDLDWLPCTDGKARPVESGAFPLAHGIPGRVGRLRAYGNAIVPQVAAEFIAAYMNCPYPG